MGEIACGGVSWTAGWFRRMDEVTGGPTRRGDAQTRGVEVVSFTGMRALIAQALSRLIHNA